MSTDKIATTNTEAGRSGILARRLIVLGIVVAAGVWWAVRRSQPNDGVLLSQAELAMVENRHVDAKSLADQILKMTPQSSAALLIAGDAERAMGNQGAAIEYYSAIRENSSREWIQSQLLIGLLQLELGNASLAEARFRELLRVEPDHAEAHLALAQLLAKECRRSEAVPHVLALFRQNQVNIDLLSLLGLEQGGTSAPEFLERCYQQHPDDATILLGLACEARTNRDADRALQLLQAAVHADPGLLEAQAELGRQLWDMQRDEDFGQWIASQGAEADDHATIWALRGAWAEKQGASEAAIRCYWESLVRNPDQKSANYRIAQLLESLDRSQAAAPFQERSVALARLVELRDILFSREQTSLAPLRQLVEHLELLGRFWEAWGWCRIARRIDTASSQWFVVAADRVRSQLEPSVPLTHPAFNPARNVRLDEFPLPDRKRNVTTQESDNQVIPMNRVSFRDDAARTGLSFRYFNSPSEPGTGQRMYEFNGGGCGILDYDGDGWPDVHLTQGCRRPVDESVDDHVDCLFRNLGDGRFTDVTSHAGLVENRFSTGLSAGDFDNDGFTDLYIANIGANRLFHNNGDGTFSDVTELAEVDDPRWTTSTVLADLNGDGLADIYSTNYLEASDIYTRVCAHPDGRPRMCMPFHFPAAPDQLFLNLGNGKFANVTSGSGIDVPNGKGLGVVAADWTGDGKLSVFVANDEVENFFFVNQTDDSARPPQFTNRGLTSGLAYSGAGATEGCMGIAVGDINVDGIPDLFVTNFYQETNTLYLSRGLLAFEDATRQADLALPGIPMLGFGTQFLDADLDGRLDLLLTNGHIDDYSAYGRPYRMPAQFYRNLGDGQFAEISADQLGTFFAAERLGRGLALIDWNRDGRMDAAVSHLADAAALLTNTTATDNHYLALQLRGVTTQRDAIGTTVQIRAGESTWTGQLTAGDGYQASNQRQLTFGLGQHATVDELIVRWPSGTIDTFRKVPVDREYLAIEERPGLYTLPNDR